MEHWLLLDSLCKQKSYCIITINDKINVWKCKLIFPTDSLQQKIDKTDLNNFLAGENTCYNNYNKVLMYTFEKINN